MLLGGVAGVGVSQRRRALDSVTSQGVRQTVEVVLAPSQVVRGEPAQLLLPGRWDQLAAVG